MGKLLNKYLTNNGMELIAKKLLGEDKNTEFTRFAAGCGNYANVEDPEQLDKLVDERVSFDIIGKSILNKTTAVIIGRLINYDKDKNFKLDEGFLVTEVGLYANDPDLGEILYSVFLFEHEYMPAFDGQFVAKMTFSVYTDVARAANVTVNINPDLYADAQALLDLTDKVEKHIEACQVTYERLLERINTIYVAATEPGTMEPGDWWYKPIRERAGTTQGNLLIETSPLSDTSEYVLQTETKTEQLDTIGGEKPADVIHKFKNLLKGDDKDVNIINES